MIPCDHFYDTYALIKSLIAFNKKAQEVLSCNEIRLLALNLLLISPDEPTQGYASPPQPSVHHRWHQAYFGGFLYSQLVQLVLVPMEQEQETAFAHNAQVSYATVADCLAASLVAHLFQPPLRLSANRPVTLGINL